MVFLWWCFSGGVFVVVWCSTGVVLEWCFCGGVFLVKTPVDFFTKGVGHIKWLRKQNLESRKDA